MRTGQKQLTMVVMACGSLVLVAAITVKLSANQSTASVSPQSATTSRDGDSRS